MTIHVTPMTLPWAAPARYPLALRSALRSVTRKLMREHRAEAPSDMPPLQHPFDRALATIDTIDLYASGAPVWAHIGGRWLPATVAATTGSSAMVTYTVPGSAYRTVETVHIRRLQLLDRPSLRRGQHGGPTDPNGAFAGAARATPVVLDARPAAEGGAS
ncbi:hypothetical protein AB0M47_04900 [Hamadaea sp. NPDC051192]|uniref:hypothetical protein n=1 Tax=Hamadaea sp. NPDC051192 TaxID=3154940 RepID=UPI0034450C39